MSKGQKIRKGKKNASRNDIRRREYAKMNKGKKEERRRTEGWSGSAPVRRTTFGWRDDSDRIGDRFGKRVSFESRLSTEFTKLIKGSDRVILEPEERPNLGNIYLWRLNNDRALKHTGMTYAIKNSFGFDDYVLQVGSWSCVFLTGNYSQQEKKDMLYQRALDQSQKFAEKNSKTLVDRVRSRAIAKSVVFEKGDAGKRHKDVYLWRLDSEPAEGCENFVYGSGGLSLMMHSRKGVEFIPGSVHSEEYAERVLYKKGMMQAEDLARKLKLPLMDKTTA